MKHLRCAETAPFVRKALAVAFPGIKFSVRSETYSGGASITVSWTDGPRTPEVEAITRRLEGADFDGMIDLKSYRSHWLTADGRLTLAHIQGSEGSGGCIPQERYPASSISAAEEVHLGADFIFCNRHISDPDAKQAEAETWIRTHCRTEGIPPHDVFGRDRVEWIARHITWDRGVGESVESAFNRRFHS